MNDSPTAKHDTSWRIWLSAGAILAMVTCFGHHLTAGAASREAAAKNIASLEADIQRATDLTVGFEAQTKELEQKKADVSQQVDIVNKSLSDAKALETKALDAQRENLTRRWSAALDELQDQLRAASLRWEDNP